MQLIKVPLMKRHLSIDTCAGRFLLIQLIYRVELPGAVNIAIEMMLRLVLYGLGLIGMLVVLLENISLIVNLVFVNVIVEFLIQYIVSCKEILLLPFSPFWVE